MIGDVDVQLVDAAFDPRGNAAELALIYRAKGIEPEAAERLAGRIMLRPAAALDTLARDELGLDPSDLVSPWVAAIASFVTFAAGAFVPVVPYIVGSGTAAFVASALLAALVLSLVGLMISILTGRSAFVTAGRMLVIGVLAASATYGIGKAIGVSVS